MKRGLKLLALLMLCAFPLTAQGATFPDKPVTLIVPWGPGGNADVQARILAKAAEPLLGHPIPIVNKPGGGTIPGVTEALSAPADGYTLIWIAAPSVCTQPHLRKTPYSASDVAPLANVSENVLVLYVRKDAPWQTLQQFLDAAKEKSLSMSLNEIGGLPHLAAVELAQKSGAKFKYVTANSSVNAVIQLLGKHVDAAFGHEPQAFSHGEGIRALAVFEPKRSASLPDVPTARELGHDVIGYTRDGVAISAKAPADIQAKLADVFRKAMETPEFKADFASRSIKALYLSPADTRKMWDEASARYKTIIDGLKANK